ncbi:MAG: DNA adenine methylase [Candidatus Accumulibacter sp.]|nr:DNA adenine methylase [Accumulibacter sp.]
MNAAIDVLGRLFTRANNTKSAYNKLRIEFNAVKAGSDRLEALFIYLLWHTTNGLCRYNKKGNFNASFGYRNATTGAAVSVPEKALRRIVAALGKATSNVSDMRATLAAAGAGDVSIIDPPYRPPVGKKATHVSYTKDGFSILMYRWCGRHWPPPVAVPRYSSTTTTRPKPVGCMASAPRFCRSILSGKSARSVSS